MLNENPEFHPLAIDVDIATAEDNVVSVNMKNYHKCTFLIQLVDLGTADTTILVYSGATKGAVTSALPFRYRIATAKTPDAGSDIFGAWVECAATGLVLAHGTYDDFAIQVQVNAAAMDIANEEEYLVLDFKDASGNATGQAIVWAALYPRYSQETQATAIV